MGKFMSLEKCDILGDDRGQLLTLDLLVSLIPIVLVLGISANAMTGVVNQMQGYAFNYDNQRVVDSAADVLVKTTGEPGNWTASSPPDILGLARFNNSGLDEVQTYYLDPDKLTALDSVFDTAMPALLSNDTNSFSYVKLTITGASQNTTDQLISWNVGDKANASNIFLARRMALVRFSDLLGSFIDIEKFYQTQQCAQQGANPLFMLEFNVTAVELAANDYWLVVVTNETSATSPSSTFYIDREDAGIFSQSANTTDCSDYLSPNIGGNTDFDNSIFPCNVNDPPYAPGSGQDEICDEGVIDPTLAQYKFKLDAELTSAGNGGNRLFLIINAASGESIDLYLIKTLTNTDDTLVSPGYAEYTPIILDLEAGK
jgi:hypothetical protein